MTKRMLIDASHAEETRVVMLDGNRLEDYDVETAAKKQLKGNIYLAKIVRVEPSLQAAFVEYGGNRHGFLAFSEIHPDYFQIPVADRQRLIALQEEEAEAERAAEEAAPEHDTSDAEPADPHGSDAARQAGDETDGDEPGDAAGQGDTAVEATAEAPGNGDSDASDARSLDIAADRREADDELGGFAEAAPPPETIGGQDDNSNDGADRARRAAQRLMRHYKIQEVIRRRQIVLVQVVKEERGTKGAALTTYISLAGRYCVLMPNSPRGGGVSRKITAVADRKRLKEITSELDIPRGMALIVRTAGAQRPRPEIKRDCEYLLRLWDEIRDTTMASTAPALIYEEASLIKRAIRDVYSSDVDDILVDGAEGWRAARGFMRMLMPSHARKVQLWRENQPLFARHNVEGFLDAMLNPTVQLRSGGYLVINQTEALVAIDVNSGRATRERGIEETALRTNLEAAEEVARQLRLRDLAGLIVIDFIDMESRKHNAMVERRLKDALKADRARIQVGSISHFGLMEMSRQRLRPSLAENSFAPCPHCNGTGLVRGTESAALHVLRAIEAVGAARDAAEIAVRVAASIVLYILNHKRDWVAEIERRCVMQVSFEIDDTLAPPLHEIRKTQIRSPSEVEPPPPRATIAADAVEAEIIAEEEEAEAREAASIARRKEADAGAGTSGGAGSAAETRGDDESERRRKRRRRRRRGGRSENESVEPGENAAGSDEEDGFETETVAAAHPADAVHAAPDAIETEASPDADDGVSPPEGEGTPGGERDPRKRRRGRRSGRRRSEESHVALEGAPQPDLPAPVYQGPTPANPFVGTFDIFDALERSEEALANNPASSAASFAAAAEGPATHDAPEVDTAADFARHEAPLPGHADGDHARPDQIPADQIHADQIHVEPAHPGAPGPAPEAEASPAPEPEPEPERGPAVQPILVGAGEPAASRRSGWWRR